MDKSKKKNPHDGHRKRFRDRMRSEGLMNFEEHEILEYLLYCAYPRGNTNETAHRLIDEFGSLAQVLDADPENMRGIVSENTALYLTSLPGIYSRYGLSKLDEKANLGNPKNCREYFQTILRFGTKEFVYMASINNRGQLLKLDLISEGVENESVVYTGQVVANAKKHRATGVILAHNHPSGNSDPSPADRNVTAQVAIALHTAGVKLVEHIIIAGESSFSFAQTGELQQIYDNAHITIKKGRVTDVRH